MCGGTEKDLELFMASFHFSLLVNLHLNNQRIKEKAYPVWLLTSNASGIEEMKANLCSRALSL